MEPITIEELDAAIALEKAKVATLTSELSSLDVASTPTLEAAKKSDRLVGAISAGKKRISELTKSRNIAELHRLHDLEKDAWAKLFDAETALKERREFMHEVLRPLIMSTKIRDAVEISVEVDAARKAVEKADTAHRIARGHRLAHATRYALATENIQLERNT